MHLKWGIRAQVLVALMMVVGFGLSVSFVVTSQVTDNAVFDARVDKTRAVGKLIAGQLDLMLPARNYDVGEAMAAARRLVVPDRLLLVDSQGRPWRPRLGPDSREESPQREAEPSNAGEDQRGLTQFPRAAAGVRVAPDVPESRSVGAQRHSGETAERVSRRPAPPAGANAKGEMKRVPRSSSKRRRNFLPRISPSDGLDTAGALPEKLTLAMLQQLLADASQHVVLDGTVETLVVAAPLLASQSRLATPKANPKNHAAATALTGAHLVVLSDLAANTTRRGVLTRLLAFFTLMIVALALLLGYVLLGRLVVRPVQSLVRPVERLGFGEFAAADTSHASSKEMLQLYEAFNTMSAQLSEDRGRIEAQLHELTLKNRDLDAAQAQLLAREKLATVGTLAAGVAHEIGNPIAVLQGYLELLEDPEVDEVAAIRYRSAMNDAARRISTIISDLLDFARPIDPEDRVCDAAAIVAAGAQLVEPQPRFRHVSLQVDKPDTPIVAGINAGRLEQVLLNLLFNAADASPEGGVVRLSVSIRDDDPERPICVQVADAGPGIDSAVLRQMFDPFFTTKEPGEGTGLGLSICHNIVASYGGRIYAEVPKEGGTTFTVRLRRPPPSGSRHA